VHSTLNDLDRTTLSDVFTAWTTVLGNEGVDYESVQAGDVVDIGDPDILIEVLGLTVEQPAGTDALRWFGDKAHTINGHSVVLRLTYDEVSVLLSGDVNIEGAEPILTTPELAAKLDAHVLKAPHHGSHEFDPAFLDAVNPQITSISSGEIPDHGHPRANFLGAVGQRSRSDIPLLFSTALSAVFSKAERSSHQEAVDATPADNEVQRELFQKLLPGIINVRTDGHQMHAATRVQTGYWWVIFFPIEPAPCSFPSP
jgi:competence protein ComEC